MERTVQQSILDRLIDDEPAAPADPPSTTAQSARRFKAAVRRDLEALLNTRRIPDEAPEALAELRQSLYQYGLPDITSLSSDSIHTRTLLVQRIEETIRTFEPRLSGVRVTVSAGGDGGARELRFLIEGLLRMDPGPEQVAFDTVLELSSGAVEVGGEPRA